MRKTTLGLALMICAAASVVATSSPVFAQGEPIKFGAVVSATGVGAGLGVNERNGLLLAEKTINAKGGFKGRPIRMIIEDDTSNPDTAVTKVNDLIFNQKVIAVFGASLLGPAVAIGGITDAAKIPQLDIHRASDPRWNSSASACSTCCRRTNSMRARFTNTPARSAPRRSACCMTPATATW